MKDPIALAAIQNMLKEYPGGAQLFTGALRYDPKEETYANSLIRVEASGEVSNIFDKFHLVPFGEYIPFQKWIPLAPIVQFQGFTKGPGLQTFQTAEGLRYSPLVCYEIIFPGRSIVAGSAPDFIINVTNDGWYGRSAGPYQHFIMAKFRAIETGIPVLRVANTGFTGLFDPLGQLSPHTQLFEERTLTTPLPVSLNDQHITQPIQ